MRLSQFTDTPVRHREIDEPPQIIGATDWDLSDPEVNATRARAFLALNPKLLETYSAAKLMHAATPQGGQYALISDRSELEYWVNYETRNIPALNRCATQVKLWRMRTASVTYMAKVVFDNYLLSDFDTIVSDSQQTSRGMEFWQVQLAGHGQTKTVGVIVGDNIKLYDGTLTMGRWLDTVGGWGRQSFNRAVRFFISNRPRQAISAPIARR